MKNPIIITYEFHSDVAAYKMRLEAWPTLLREGYPFFVDEELQGVTLEGKLSVLKKTLSDPQLPPARLRTHLLEIQLLEFLKANRCQYDAADLSKQKILNTVGKNINPDSPIDVHFTNIMVGALLPLRDASLCRSIAKAAKKGGVIAAAGYRHAAGMQQCFQDNYPYLDIISVYAYSDPAPDEIDSTQCDLSKKDSIFPTGVHIIDANNEIRDSHLYASKMLKYLYGTYNQVTQLINSTGFFKTESTTKTAATNLIALVDAYKEMTHAMQQGDHHRKEGELDAALNSFLIAKKHCAQLTGFNHQKGVNCTIRMKISLILNARGEVKAANEIYKRVVMEMKQLPFSNYISELNNLTEEYSSKVNSDHVMRI